MVKLCHIEFNEANFELIELYLQHANERKWPNLRKIMQFDRVSTISEGEYENIEPWIQWVSVHTGKTFNEHRIFRLGDSIKLESEQIFEWAERKGLKVGSISAMNATNKLNNPKFFIPDPWTKTNTDGSLVSQQIYRALKQAVNDNSSGKLTVKTKLVLIAALILKTKRTNWMQYFSLGLKSLRGRRWNKALFLDLFLSDLHVNLCKKHKPDFTTLFLNAFAHIQHHYYFSSKYYTGSLQNPPWYISAGLDPIEDALGTYDKLFGDIISQFSEYELIISTGLRQVPYVTEKYYYRLRDHSKFLNSLGVKFKKVHPRMTRDFLVDFDNVSDCLLCQKLLAGTTINNVPVFSNIENRGCTLFVTLTYPNRLDENDRLNINADKTLDPNADFVFVAIKNGMHDGKGYVCTSRKADRFLKLEGCHVFKINTYLKERMVAETSK